MASIIKEVFGNRNVAVISITTTAYTAFTYLWQIWWSLYLYELGAPIPVIALLSTIQTTSSQVFQLPGGFLADKFGRKNVVIFGTTLRLIYPVIYLLADTWEELVPGQILLALASIYMPAFHAMIADSMPYRVRGTAYGVYRTLTTLPGVFMPVVSGIYMDQVGLMEGMKVGFIFSFFIALTIFVVRLKLLRETLTPTVRARDTKLKAEGAFSRLRFRLRGTLLVMLIVSCLGSLIMHMVQPFFSIYAVELLGLTKGQYGSLQTASMALIACLSLPAGMLTDKWGRKKSILLARFGLPFHRLVMVYARFFVPIETLYPTTFTLWTLTSLPTGLGGGAEAGGGTGGPSWSALMADLVPPSDRGKVIGTMATITGLASMPGATIGAYIWGLSPDAVLITAFVGGLIPPLIFYIFAKEPEAKTEE